MSNYKTGVNHSAAKQLATSTDDFVSDVFLPIQYFSVKAPL
jgi:hypothetical protein